MDQPHDDFFHCVFQHPRHAGPWLRDVVPAEIVAKIDWKTLVSEPEKVHRRSMRQEITDIVHSAWRVDQEKNARQGKVRFVSEHKSWEDGEVENQLTSYAILLTRRALTDEEEPPALVIPILLRHGPTPRAHVAGPPSVEQSFHPRVRILVDDLSRQSEAQIRTRGLSALGTLTFLCFRFLRGMTDEEALGALARWGDLLRAADRDGGPPAGEAAIEAIACYCLRVRDLPTRKLQRHLANILRRPERTIMSTAERLKREGHALGLVEGEEKGRLKGRAETLLQQLQKRFGTVPDTVENRLRAAPDLDLHRWTDRVLDATTIDEVFAD